MRPESLENRTDLIIHPEPGSETVIRYNRLGHVDDEGISRILSHLIKLFFIIFYFLFLVESEQKRGMERKA